MPVASSSSIPVASSRLVGYCLLFAGMATVGTYVALSKPLTAAIPVFLLATLRFGIAAIVMLPWLRRASTDQPITRPIAHTLFAQSFFGNFLFSISMLYGVSLTSATSAGLILSTMPAVVALLSWLLLRERLSAQVWLAVALAVAGVGLLTALRSTSAGSAAGDSMGGNLLVLACVFCEATYVILGKRLTSTLSAKRISALINLIGLALMLPFGLIQASSFNFASLSLSMWLLLVFYSVAASMIATWLWLTGLRSVPASHSGIFTIALPIAACLVGVLWLGETLTLAHGLAFTCALAGIILIAAPVRRCGRATDGI